jgi:hypothetical protein
LRLDAAAWYPERQESVLAAVVLDDEAIDELEPEPEQLVNASEMSSAEAAR